MDLLNRKESKIAGAVFGAIAVIGGIYYFGFHSHSKKKDAKDAD
jgi:hypothetical protein